MALIMKSTWSPFQSAAFQQTCAHMTDEEMSRALRRSFLYGIWVMATFAGPLALLMLTSNFALRVAAIILMLVHIASLPTWLKMQRQFLCSLDWAREQGMTPEHLKLLGKHVIVASVAKS